MKKPWFYALAAAALLLAAMAERWFGYEGLSRYAGWLLALSGVMLVCAALRRSYHKPGAPWPAGTAEPMPLRIRPLDYGKALICWFDAFTTTYAVEPGLYYTGDRYDPEAPLLVTANYHLTVFLVARRVRAFNARILVVDTDGINAWCSAGKGAFNNAAITAQLDRYPRTRLTQSKWLPMILPKVAFAGVDLRALRDQNIKAIVGPIYAKDLPEYLAHPPYRDRDAERVHFGLQSRVFTWVPGLIQYVGYSIKAAIVLFALEWAWGIEVPLGIVPVAAILGTGYPLLFPWLPGERFAVKGLWLGAATAAGLVVAVADGWLAPSTLWAGVPFIFGAALLIALSYTGNSAVSNYSRVRAEIARFLPLDVAFFVASFAAFVIGGR